MEEINLAILPTAIIDAISLSTLHDKCSLSFMRLPHPRTRLPCLFLSYIDSSRDSASKGTESRKPRTKVVEVQAVSPVNEQSWFLDSEVVEDGRLLVMTPIDPAFLLLPILHLTCPSGSPGTFRPADEMFDEAILELERSDSIGDEMKQCAKDILRFCALDCTQQALSKVCEVKEITAEIVVYRYSEPRATEYFKEKVSKLAVHSVMEGSKTILRGFAREGLMDDGKEELLKSATTEVACDLVSQYLPAANKQSLKSSYDFTKLIEHRKMLSDEAAARIAATEAALPRKKGAAAAVKTDGTKKRKGAQGSQGVEKLKKANVNGMAKLSSFFKAKEAA